MMSEQQLKSNNLESTQAILDRKSDNATLELTEDKLKQIVSLVIDEQLTDRLTKIENRLNQMLDRLESVSNKNSNSDNTNVILSKINLSKEEYYPYTCSTLADCLKVRPYDLAKIIKNLGLREDSKYHLCIATGRTGKVHKYSEAALQKLMEKLSPQKSA
jgi:YesN/AraC family two-component response regulator